MRRNLFIGLLLGAAGCGSGRPAAPPVPVVDANEIEATLLRSGDAGAPALGGEPVLRALRTVAATNPHQNLVLFLGDNIYPHGLPPGSDPQRGEAERRLVAQIEVLTESRARGVFIPGNHDWDTGAEAVRRQQRLIDERGQGLATQRPAGACPGPDLLDVTDEVRLILIDTGWWLYDGPRGSDDCERSEPEDVLAALRGALDEAGQRHVLFVAHHPLDSGGRHGGHFDLLEHIFPLRHAHPNLWIPLPLLGSIYPVVRMLGFVRQDLPSDGYQAMIAGLRATFAVHPPLAAIAGHEHNLQVLRGAPERYILVSGGGIFGHTSQAHLLENTEYAAKAAGFMRLDILHSGRIRLGVLVVDEEGEASETFATWLE
jgi:hypothetical protein